MAEIKTIIKYLEEEKEYKFINNYQTFLHTCYKAFDMSEEEKKSLKIFLIDEEGDEISIDSEIDFKENLNSNENNELIYLLKSCKKKMMKTIKKKMRKKMIIIKVKIKILMTIIIIIIIIMKIMIQKYQIY